MFGPSKATTHRDIFAGWVQNSPSVVFFFKNQWITEGNVWCSGRKNH
jgi:hypothetical protein